MDKWVKKLMSSPVFNQITVCSRDLQAISSFTFRNVNLGDIVFRKTHQKNKLIDTICPVYTIISSIFAVVEVFCKLEWKSSVNFDVRDKRPDDQDNGK